MTTEKKNVTDSCGILTPATFTKCPGFDEVRDISHFLQNNVGDVLYTVLAYHYDACVIKNIEMSVRIHQKEDRCKILSITNVPQRCENKTVYTLIKLILNIYMDEKDPDKNSRHASNLLINHKEKNITYFDPNGSNWVTNACISPLQKWAEINYPGYKFITPMEFCPVGPQGIDPQNTCWLWALLHFVSAISCPNIPNDQLMNNIISKGQEYVGTLISRFACWLYNLAQDLHLSVIRDFYLWFEDRIDWDLRPSYNKEDLQKAIDWLNDAYDRGDISRLLDFFYQRIRISNHIWWSMPPWLQKELVDLEKITAPIKILKYPEYVKMREENKEI